MAKILVVVCKYFEVEKFDKWYGKIFYGGGAARK